MFHREQPCPSFDDMIHAFRAIPANKEAHMSKPTTLAPMSHRELSSKEIDMVSGGVKAVEMPSPVPTMHLKYTFTDVMVES
jgi:hypothetical protein